MSSFLTKSKKVIEQFTKYLDEPSAAPVTMHEKIIFAPRQEHNNASQLYVNKDDDDKNKAASNRAKKPNACKHPTRLQQLLQLTSHKITDIGSALKESNHKWRVAGWGIGTISKSSIISFKRSEKIIGIPGFRAKFPVPAFFRTRSATVNRPTIRQAATEMNTTDRGNRRGNLPNGKPFPDISYREPIPPLSELTEQQRTKIELILKPLDRLYDLFLKDKDDTRISSGGHRTDNGDLSTKMKAIFDKLAGQADINNIKYSNKPDDLMSTLALSMLSVANDVLINSGSDPTKKISEAQCYKALDILKNLKLEDSFTIPAATDMDQATAANGVITENDLAWRIAYKLAETSMGFDLLKRITAHPADGPQTALSETDEAKKKRKQIRQDANMRLFMVGASKLLEKNASTPGLSCDPSSLIKHCVKKVIGEEKLSDTLLLKALPGLQQAMRKESDTNHLGPNKTAWDEEIDKIDVDPVGDDFLMNRAAQKRLIDLSTSKWAVNALRNGFDTNAPGSDFDKANQRLEKVTVQLTRSLQHGGGEVEERDITAASDMDKKALLPRFLKPLKLSGKSMFRNNLYFENSTNGPLIQREKMQLALRILEKKLRETGDYDVIVTPDGERGEIPKKIAFNGGVGDFDFDRFVDPSKTEDNEKIVANIAKIIILDAWLKMPMSENISGYPLSERSLRKEERNSHIQNFFKVNGAVENSPAGTKLFQLVSDKIESLKNSCLTPELLRDWATIANMHNAGLPRDQDRLKEAGQKIIPDLKNIENMELEKLTPHFFNAIDHLVTGYDKEDIHLQKYSKAGTIDYMQKQVQRMRLGSSIKMTDGAALGFGLQGTFAALSRIGTAFVASGRASLSSKFGRVAQMDIGVNAAGGFARFGVLTDQRTRAGGGGSVGWRIGKKSGGVQGGLSAGVDVKGILDTDQFEGVGLRLDRLSADVTGREGQVAGVAGDADMSNELSKIVGQVMKGRQTPADVNGIQPPRLNNDSEPTLLEQLLEDNAGLSVTWIGEGNSHSRTIGVTEQFSAIAGVHAAGIGGAALSLSAGSTQTHRNQQHNEFTGALRSRVISTGHRVANTLQFSATLGIQNSDTNNNEKLSKFGISGAEVATGDAEVYRSGITEEIRTVEYLGMLQNQTYKLIIHAKAESFIEKVGSAENLSDWGHAFAKIKNKNEYGSNDMGPGHEKMAARHSVVGEQTAIVRDLLKQTELNADPNVSHIEYLEILPEIVAQINRYKSLAMVLRKANLLEYNNQAATLEDAAETLLKNENSYSKRFLFSIEKRATDKGHKFNMLANFQSTSGVQATTMTNEGFWG